MWQIPLCAPTSLSLSLAQCAAAICAVASILLLVPRAPVYCCSRRSSSSAVLNYSLSNLANRFRCSREEQGAICLLSWRPFDLSLGARVALPYKCNLQRSKTKFTCAGSILARKLRGSASVSFAEMPISLLELLGNFLLRLADIFFEIRYFLSANLIKLCKVTRAQQDHNFES